MQEPQAFADAPDASAFWARPVLALARIFALAGGGLFIGLIALSLVSIIGRKLANAPVIGDVEIMQVGTAAAAAMLLPLCTILGEQLRVDFFTESASPAVRRLLDTVADLLLAAVFLLLAWRTGHQALDVREAGEVTPLVSWPVWIPTAMMVPSFALTAVCALAHLTRLWRREP